MKIIFRFLILRSVPINGDGCSTIHSVHRLKDSWSLIGRETESLGHLRSGGHGCVRRGPVEDSWDCLHLESKVKACRWCVSVYT